MHCLRIPRRDTTIAQQSTRSNVERLFFLAKRIDSLRRYCSTEPKREKKFVCMTAEFRTAAAPRGLSNSIPCNLSPFDLKHNSNSVKSPNENKITVPSKEENSGSRRHRGVSLVSLVYMKRSGSARRLHLLDPEQDLYNSTLLLDLYSSRIQLFGLLLALGHSFLQPHHCHSLQSTGRPVIQSTCSLQPSQSLQWHASPSPRLCPRCL